MFKLNGKQAEVALPDFKTAHQIMRMMHELEEAAFKYGKREGANEYRDRMLRVLHST